MCDPAIWYKFGNQSHPSSFWKISKDNNIYFVCNLTENPDGSMIGQLLLTQQQYLEEHRALNTAAKRSFEVHDQQHKATSSQQIVHLILVEDGFIEFAITEVYVLETYNWQNVKIYWM